MRFLVCLFAIAALAALASANPDLYTNIGRSDVSVMHEFTVSFRHQNKDMLDQITMRVSDPKSPDYANWPSMESLIDLTSPSDDQIARVVDFLAQRGIESRPYGLFLRCNGLISDINNVFQTEFYQFQHKPTGLIINRSSEGPIIPAEISNLVNFVTGLANFPQERRSPIARHQSPRLAGDDLVIPTTIRNLYGIPTSAKGTNSQSSQGVVEFALSAGISDSDLKTFMQETGGDTSAALAYTVGNYAPFNPSNGVDTECTLDVQYIMAIAVDVPTSFWVVDGWIYDFTTLVMQRQSDKQPVPWIFSISYGWNEGDQCEVTGMGTSCKQLGGSNEDYVDSTSTNVQIITTSGISIIISSGDAGAASANNESCTNRTAPVEPVFPASCPYVTAVGATMLKNGGTALSGTGQPPICSNIGVTCAGGGTEITCSVPEALITSGGGFSNFFSRSTDASYQNSAVSGWLNNGALEPPSQYFNSAGRAYPDTSALGHNYYIEYNGEMAIVDGTSASAPVTAAILSLINDARFNKGMSSIGFANPTIYTMNTASSLSTAYFNDITLGNNTGTEKHGLTETYCFTYGYGASAGWDPATGCGSPNYNNWLSYWT